MYITIEEMQENYTLFGSRALDVADELSDYDFAISLKEFSKLNKENRLPEGCYVDIMKYMQALPHNPVELYSIQLEDKNENVYLVDLLIFECPLDVEVIKKSIKALQQYPKQMLIYKCERVKLYNEQLVKNGFLLQEPKGVQRALTYSKAFSELTNIYLAYRKKWINSFLTVENNVLYFNSPFKPTTNWVPTEEDIFADDWVVELRHENVKSV